MKTFKNIVVATDFSESSVNAYKYARQIASRFGADLKVVHVYEIPVNPSHPEYFNLMPSLDELEEVANARLSRFVNEGGDSNGNTLVASRLKVTSEAMIGFPTDRLIELSKDPSVDLMILGTVGEHGWADKIFGSVAVKVVSEAYCPVLLIPQNAEYHGIHHSLYASSAESASGKDIGVAIDFAKYFVSALHFVHISTDKDKTEGDGVTKIKQILEQKAPKLPYSVEKIPAEDIATGIYNYCSKNDINLIITVTHHRGFWDSLMHRSITKDLTWKSQLPILCIHTDDQVQPPV